jgi:uncharacterized protein (UPF0210 family)
VPLSPSEILETIKMVATENLDVRTVTMGISLQDCVHPDPEALQERIYNKIVRYAGRLVPVCQEIEAEYGIPIINKRVAITPVALISQTGQVDHVALARTLDEAAQEVGVDFLGGFSALVHKGFTKGDRRLLEAIPEALAVTERVCSSINVASTRAGINMDAVQAVGMAVVETAQRTADRDGIGCAKLVAFANAPEDNPFMAGGFHGVGEPEAVINVGVSGPGVVHTAVQKLGSAADLGQVADTVKKTAFKITRMGELVGRLASQRLGVRFGIVDLSLAPTPTIGDSIANILEAMGLERCGAHGTTAALALLNDAVKKGGAMASSHVGGLSGAFIPVSEDAGMVAAVQAGALTFDKLEAMTSVCSVGLDMIAIPGDTPAETIAAIIADEAAIGVVNNKTTAVRVIPAPGKTAGEWVEFGGLLGRAPVLPVSGFCSASFVRRGGQIPAPINSLRN